MLLTSFIQDSFQEFEGHQSLVLFAQGCNLRCVECYNLEQIINPSLCVGEARQIIDENITPLHDAVVFLGGEPTIHTDLPVLTHYCKNDKGLATKIYTNGLNPAMIEMLNKNKFIDAYSVDFKTIDNTELLGVDISIDRYLYFVRKSIDNILESGINLELRTTKWTGVNVEGIKEFLAKNYPQVRHIIQEKFETPKNIEYEENTNQVSWLDD